MPIETRGQTQMHGVPRTARLLIKRCILTYGLSFSLGPEHLHDPADPVLHLPVMEGHHQLSPHRFDGLLDPSAAG